MRPASPPDLEARLRFLRSPAAHEPDAARQAAVQTIETHMSWVFMAGDHVLKMKKPVRYPYLDFSTLAAREFCCREEVRLNSRLAPGVYEGLRALHWDGQALTLLPESALPAPGTVLDWLVRMRRLPRSRMLDALLAAHEATPAQVKALADRLLAFYKGLPAVAITGIEYVSRFEREQIVNREVLMRAEFDLHDAAAALRALDLGLRDNAVRLRERADSGHIVEGHGDLRPEHVCLLDPPVVIDALEFNAAFRQVDPLDEIAYLGMECEAAGAAWIGPQLVGCVGSALEVAQHAPLIAWYTAFRALLRARLVAAHLLEPQPRRAGHWLPLARRYVGLALRALAAS